MASNYGGWEWDENLYFDGDGGTRQGLFEVCETGIWVIDCVMSAVTDAPWGWWRDIGTEGN